MIHSFAKPFGTDSASRVVGTTTRADRVLRC
ncbi:MAG: hypothetical protein JWN52_6117 [Actinomycetia bacterium]|nr:hypothetical protein [Actinomycetes bacterium]